MNHIDRFYHYVPNRPNDSCWIWEGYKTKSGYGSIMINRKQIRDNKTWRHINV